MGKETVTLKCALVTVTAQAILVMSEFDKEVWLPKSRIDNFEDHKDGTCSFEIDEDYASDRELV